ncbi:MAG: thiamine phosphate synthase [Planctomycetes bacterium]|nr:thiamine phosphate synthase [Planctomycetota bacterium]
MVVAEAALRGGADVIQLREKQLTDTELLDRTLKLRQLTRKHDALLIINDRADIALLSDADGVHVGLEDLPVAEVRRIVGPHRLIGATVHSIEEAKKTIDERPDYLGVGPMFASSTKPAVPVNGPALLHRIHEEMLKCGVGIPLVAIGGIASSNVDELRLPTLSEHCPVAIAVSQAVIGSDRPEDATRQLKSKLEQRMVAHDNIA